MDASWENADRMEEDEEVNSSSSRSGELLFAAPPSRTRGISSSLEEWFKRGESRTCAR